MSVWETAGAIFGIVIVWGIIALIIRDIRWMRDGRDDDDC